MANIIVLVCIVAVTSFASTITATPVITSLPLHQPMIETLARDDDDESYDYDQDLDIRPFLQNNLPMDPDEHNLAIYKNSEELEDQDTNVVHDRTRRQAPNAAMDLSLSHTNANGGPRPIGRVHGHYNLRGSGTGRNNHHLSGSVGLGSVVYRSRNGRHSVGVGATVDKYRGRHHGFRYQSRPNFGAGIGYRYRF